MIITESLTKIILDGKEFWATRNIMVARQAAGNYKKYSIRCRIYDGNARLYVKPCSYWHGKDYIGTLFFDNINNKVIFHALSEYNPDFIFVCKVVLDEMLDNDEIIVKVKSGSVIKIYRQSIGKLREFMASEAGMSGMVSVPKNVFRYLRYKKAGR